MKLSVITVTYNNEETINDYLLTVLKNIPDDSEIIIVDSGSSDQTVEILKKEKKVSLIECRENVGYGKGNNMGVEQARGEYLLLLNPDTKVVGNSIKRLLDFGKSSDDWGIIAPKLIEPDGKIQPSVRKLPTILGAVREFILGQKGAYEAYAPRTDKAIEVECAFGAVFLIKRDIFNKLGGFDSRYFMFFEDLDLCRKIRRLGLKIIYNPQIQFVHKVGGSINENKIRWSKESDRIYHGELAFAVLSLVYKVNRVKNYLRKKR